jgi:hypothetical protein
MNKNEGSIPFTRSIDYQRLAKQCSKSEVNWGGLRAFNGVFSR